MVENSWEQRDNRPGYLSYRRRARVSYQQSTIVNRPKQDQQAHQEVPNKLTARISKERQAPILN